MKINFKLPHKIEERNRLMGTIIGVAMAILFIALYAAGPLKSMDDVDLDNKFSLRKRIFNKYHDLREKVLPINQDIVFIEIDDETLSWEGTFPDDPLYYNDIVRELGEDGLGARAVVFSKDYSRPFGRKVDLETSGPFSGFMSQVSQYFQANISKKQDVVDNLLMLKDYMVPSEIGDMAGDIAARIEELIYDDEMSQLQDILGQIKMYTEEYKDLNDLAPNREEKLADSMAEAGNVYFTYSAENKAQTPYSAKDLRFKPQARALLEKILKRPTLNRPEDEAERVVFEAYMDLLPEGLEVLLAEGDKPFKSDVRARIERDLKERAEMVELFLEQNGHLAFDAEPEVLKKYVHLRKIHPVHPTIGQQSVGQGAFKAEISKDGKLRKIAPGFVFNGKVYPHIDILVTAAYLGIDKDGIEFKPDRVILKNPVHPDPSIKYDGDIVIPLDSDGTLIINWASIWADTTTFQHNSLQSLHSKIWRDKYYTRYKEFSALSPEEQEEYMAQMSQDDQVFMEAAKQVSSTITPEEAEAIHQDLLSLKNKIAVVGMTAIGTADLNPTPLEPRYPILGLHANVFNTIVQEAFIHPVADYITALLMLILGLAIGFMGGTITMKSSIVTGIVNFFIMLLVAVLFLALTSYLFIFQYLYIPVMVPVLLILLTYLTVFLYRFITEEQEKKKMKGMFSTYVNKEVVDSLIDDPSKLTLGGEWMDCTVFFSDVAGFTSISESMPPEDLVELLNEYLTAMTDIIFSYGGTLDKYIGDAIVAVYGAPIPLEDHAVRACHATIDQQVKLEEMRAAWRERGTVELTARCGVNSGRMIAGNMGSKKRFNYTVMGANVEFGEHLESGGKKWGTIMTISEGCYERAKDHVIVRLLDVDRLEGEPILIYELLAKMDDGISDEMKNVRAVYEKGVELYFARKWDEAIAQFNKVLEIKADDKPTDMAIKRCEAAKAEAPGEEFDERAEHLAKNFKVSTV